MLRYRKLPVSTGMNIIRAIVEGERNPSKLAALRHKSCKKTEKTFVDALTGNFQETHLFTLKQSLETFDYFSSQIDECDKMIMAEIQSWPYTRRRFNCLLRRRTEDRRPS